VPFAFFSSSLALIIIPDCVVFYNSAFAFGDGVICYVYNDVCESTNGVVCVIDRYHLSWTVRQYLSRRLEYILIRSF